MFDLTQFSNQERNFAIGGPSGGTFAMNFIVADGHVCFLTHIGFENFDASDLDYELQWKGNGIAGFAKLNEGKVLTLDKAIVLPADDMANFKTQMTNGILLVGPCTLRMQATSTKSSPSTTYAIAMNWLEGKVTGSLADPVVPSGQVS